MDSRLTSESDGWYITHDEGCMMSQFLSIQLRPESWQAELGRLSVLVMESGSFRNLLVKGAAQLSDIGLLVSAARMS